MQKSLREDLALRGYDLVFEYRGSTIAINTKEFTEEKEEAVYQKYGLKTLRWNRGITLYNPEVWRVAGKGKLALVEDCLTPEQPFFTVAPCLQLEGIKDLSHWDVASATNLSCLFFGCDSLKELILNGWNVSSVGEAHWMFEWCESLEKLSLKEWDVSGIKDMSWMFSGCKSLMSLSLGGWRISKDAITDWMFEDCHAGISVESLRESNTTPRSVF